MRESKSINGFSPHRTEKMFSEIGQPTNRLPMIFGHSSPWHYETRKWVDSCPVLPSVATIEAVDTFIRGCILDGNWDLFDCVSVFGQDKFINVGYCIKNPTGLPIATPVGRVHHSYKGIKACQEPHVSFINAEQGYFDYVDLTTLSRYQLSDALVAFYVFTRRRNVAGIQISNSQRLFGIIHTGNSATEAILISNSNNIGAIRCNTSGSQIHGCTNENGVWTHARTAANVAQTISPTNTTNYTSSTDGIPSGVMALLATRTFPSNVVSSKSPDGLSLIILGAAVGANVSALRTRIANLATQLGWTN